MVAVHKLSKCGAVWGVFKVISSGGSDKIQPTSAGTNLFKKTSCQQERDTPRAHRVNDSFVGPEKFTAWFIYFQRHCWAYAERQHLPSIGNQLRSLIGVFVFVNYPDRSRFRDSRNLKVLIKGAHRVGTKEREVWSRYGGLGKPGVAPLAVCWAVSFPDLPPWRHSPTGGCHWVFSSEVTWQGHKQNYYRNSLLSFALPWNFSLSWKNTFSEILLTSGVQWQCQMHTP